MTTTPSRASGERSSGSCDAPSPIGDSLLREALIGMLNHSCVADAGDDCKDAQDLAAETAARKAIAASATPPPAAPDHSTGVGKMVAQPWAPVTDAELSAMLDAFIATKRGDDMRAAGNALLTLRGGVAQGVAVDGKHWVFDAARAMRPLASQVLVDDEFAGGEPLSGMLDKIEAGMSSTKACRWLGWVQACVYMHFVASLEELKAINKAAAKNIAPQQTEGGQ